MGWPGRVHGLVSAPQHNGALCTMMAFDASRERWQVCLADGTKVALKHSNITELGGEGGHPEQDDECSNCHQSLATFESTCHCKCSGREYCSFWYTPTPLASARSVARSVAVLSQPERSVAVRSGPQPASQSGPWRSVAVRSGPQPGP
jgi:hypothetical protein